MLGLILCLLGFHKPYCSPGAGWECVRCEKPLSAWDCLRRK